MATPFISMKASTSPRFKGHFALLVFSIAALMASSVDAPDQKTRELKWVLSATSISMVFSFVLVLIQFFEIGKKNIVGTCIEGGISVFLLAIWAGGLPVIMNPVNDIAVYDYQIVNANLYFSSWICFGLIMAISGHLLQEVTGRDFVGHTASNTLKWYALMACSIVLMASSIKLHKFARCKDAINEFSGTQACARNSYAISLGVLGTVIGLVMSFLTSNGIPILAELVVSTLTIFFFTFGVGFITFGIEAPARFIGNLYFSTWFSFSVSASLFGQCACDFVVSLQKNEPNAPTETEANIVAKDDADKKMEPEVDEEIPEGPAEAMELKG